MSGDIAILWSDQHVGDIATTGSDLQTDAGLETAIIISLFSDRRAAFGEELPAGETSRRGFWGDVEPPVPGDVIGSKLWLLYREKQLPSVIARAEEYARESLQWLLDDRVATRVDVLVESTAFQRLDIQVTVYRPNNEPAQFRYNYAWQSQAAKITQ